MQCATAEEFIDNQWIPFNGIEHNKPIRTKVSWKSVGPKELDLQSSDLELDASKWESLHSIIEETKGEAEVVPLKISRLFAINFAVLIVCLFVAIITVSGFSLFFLDTGVGGKVIGFTGLFGGLLSVAFVWYNVLYMGFKESK